MTDRTKRSVVPFLLMCVLLGGVYGFFIQQAVQCGERGGAYIWNSAACVQGVTK